jgi:hypothetical protein
LGSDIIWKNYRYGLITKNLDSPIVPAPFNLLINLWYCEQTVFGKRKAQNVSNHNTFFDGILYWKSFINKKIIYIFLKNFKINFWWNMKEIAQLNI